MSGGVRCQNPKCRKILAGWLNGELGIKCRWCGLDQTIRRRPVWLSGTASNRPAVPYHEQDEQR